jgi:hypothetical protein
MENREANAITTRDCAVYSLTMAQAESGHARAVLSVNARCGPLVEAFLLGLLHRHPKHLQIRPLIVQHRLAVLDPG